jgi:hypothetical protein
MWEVEYTDEFEAWWESLNLLEQAVVYESVGLLEQKGPHLSFPYSSGIQTSRYSAMRELRSQCQGRPLRTLYVFDPRRVAVLLIGGDKTGNNRWYNEYVPLADKIYDQYLEELHSKELEEDL